MTMTFKQSIHYVVVSAKIAELNESGKRFATSLIDQFSRKGRLSDAQWNGMSSLYDQLTKKGDNRRKVISKKTSDQLKPVFDMFFNATKSLKFPKMRLITSTGQAITMKFYSNRNQVAVYSGGVKGYGPGQFIGEITKGGIISWKGKLDKYVLALLEDFIDDPMKVLVAASKRFGFCTFCGKDLTDEESKKRSYGPVCAKHYGLPYGTK